MFYDRFVYLCKKKGVSPSRAAVEAGISKSLVTKWKTSSVEIPSPEVIKKLAKYFNLPVSEFLGEETEKAPAESDKRSISDDELKFALWGDCEDVGDDDLADVRRYAAFVRERKKDQK